MSVVPKIELFEAASATAVPGRAGLSIVIPVYNEKDSIVLVVEKCIEVASCLADYAWCEVIVVDDGSTDDTFHVLSRFHEKHPELRVVRLRKNFGKSAALVAGFREARGDVVITLDGDGQDDPVEIPNFISRLNEGFDLVSGWKQHRQDPLEKTLPSRIFNFVVSRATGISLHDFNCGFKAYRAWCLRNIYISGNLHRFLPVFVAQRGGKISEIPVVHHKRNFGTSKFGLLRYFEGALDLCTVILFSRFFQKPLYFFGALGIPLMLVGGIIGSYLLGGHVYFLFTGNYDYQLVNRPLLQICVTLFGIGLHIFLIGLLAELLLSRLPNSGYEIKDKL